MDGIVEKIIGDFYERKLPNVIKRVAKLPQITGKIDTVIGMRRTGKTYFLYQNMQELLQQGITKQRLLYINFDDERLLPLATEDLQLIPIIYYRFFPEHKQQKCYFFFDEIQNVSGWERFVRRLVDTENVHIVLTGSSAKLLSKEIASTLRGRAITTEIFPFSFQETLRYKDPDIELPSYPGEQTRALLANRIRSFLLKGGFPEIQSVNEGYQRRILQEYVDVVILRDIVERYQVANVQALRAMERHLLANPATLFSVNKFYNDLQSQGIRCTKNALYDYLDYLTDTYLIYPVCIYARSKRTQRVNPRKIYLIDTGLITAFLHQPQIEWGHLLENFVYMELRRRGLAIHYYRTQEGQEVDFIAISEDGTKVLYQVCYNLADEGVFEREVSALQNAMKECGVKKGVIITLDEVMIMKENKDKNAPRIEVLPAWDWVTYGERKEQD